MSSISKKFSGILGGIRVPPPLFIYSLYPLNLKIPQSSVNYILGYILGNYSLYLPPISLGGSYIFIYVMDIKPPAYLQVYYTPPLRFCQELYMVIMPHPHILLDKTLYRVYNRIRCTLKGHTRTQRILHAHRVITNLHR